MNIKNWLAAEQLKLAYAVLPKDKKDAVDAIFGKANAQLRTFMNTGTASHRPDIPHQFLMAKAALTNDAEGIVAALPEPKAVEISVAPGGEIYGTGKYQQLDPGWVQAAAVWVEHMLLGKHKFPAGEPNFIPIPDDVTFAIAGDWGTGDYAPSPAPAIKVANQMKTINADYTIHLGDVYYAGESQQESDNFVKRWPSGKSGSFTLNSNHEMYSGATPYFNVALASPLFQLQAGFSFFALENANWVIVGLDSAYFSDELHAYLDGSIGTAAQSQQVSFLQKVGAKGKKVMVLSHHNGLDEDGSAPTALWNQVMSALGVAPAYWYWGHVHAGVVYPRQSNGTLCRCTGHAALPWGLASGLVNNPEVEWFETRNAGDASDPVRVLNGFTTVELHGADLTEVFYDENGGKAWTPATSSAAAT